MLCKHEANPQENNSTEVQPQQRRFATLLKSHPHTDRPAKICSTSTEQPSSGEYLWGTASGCQKSFKILESQKCFIYSC